jgi:hypothetical protein
MKHARHVWPVMGRGSEAEHIDGNRHGTRQVIGMERKNRKRYYNDEQKNTIVGVLLNCLITTMFC